VCARLLVLPVLALVSHKTDTQIHVFPLALTIIKKWLCTENTHNVEQKTGGGTAAAATPDASKLEKLRSCSMENKTRCPL
jgi:hypothetical protein